MIPDIAEFIDIHNHILPDIDDGPKSLKESVEMARSYVSVGITQIITTPHFIPGTAWAAGIKEIAEKIEELTACLQKEEIPLQIYPGMEIAYHKKLMDRFEKGLLQPLANSCTYLLEPSFQDTAEDLLRCSKRLNEKGQRVILAHPERIKTFQESLEPLLDQISNGLKVQLNTGSILGRFGEASHKTAMELIEKESVHYLASDAHSASNRKPVSNTEWSELAAILGSDLLTTLCIDNPNKLISN